MSMVSEIRYGRACPVVPVTNIENAISFYCGILGFSKTFENGNPIGFVILEKDHAQIDLCLNKNHKPTVDNVLFLSVSDANKLYGICEANKVKIVKKLRDADYGLRTFVVSDPDGNRIDIGQPIKEMA